MCDPIVTPILLGAGIATSIAGTAIGAAGKGKAAGQAKIAAAYQAQGYKAQYDAAMWGVKGYLNVAKGYEVQEAAYKTQAQAFNDAASGYRVAAQGYLQAAKDTAGIYSAEAAINDQNAILAHNYAEWAMRKVEQDVYKRQTAASVMTGAQTAAYASGNVDVGVGTPVDVAASTWAAAAREVKFVRLAAAEEAYGLNQQAKQYVELAKIDRLKAAGALNMGNYQAIGQEYAARGQEWAAKGAGYAAQGAHLGQQGALIAAKGATVGAEAYKWAMAAAMAGGQAQAAAYNTGMWTDILGGFGNAFKMGAGFVGSIGSSATPYGGPSNPYFSMNG